MAEYTRCCYPGCTRKAEAHYQASGPEPGTLGEMFDLCWGHITKGDKQVLKTLSRDMTKNKFRVQMAQASVTKKDTNTQEALTTNKDTLTLDNYKEVTGKRFRMTKDQKKRGISREEAFNEMMKGV